MAEWACPTICDMDFAYFGPRRAPGRMRNRDGSLEGLERLRVQMFGAIRSPLGEPNGNPWLVMVYAITNNSPRAQLLRPHPPEPPPANGGFVVRNGSNPRFLIQGSDDLQHPVTLQMVTLLDSRFRPAGDLWLLPGATMFAALEVRGVDARAAEITLRGRLLVNQADTLRFRLPAIP